MDNALRDRLEKMRTDTVQEALEAAEAIARKASMNGALHGGNHLRHANDAMIRVVVRRFREDAGLIKRLTKYEPDDRSKLLLDMMSAVRDELVAHHRRR